MDLVSATKSYKALRRFVETGELARTLGTIGDISTKAALASLKSAQFADDPERVMISTITHLQTSHAAYEEIWTKGTTTDYPDYLNALTNDQKVLALLVLSYQYVGERRLALQTLELLRSFERRALVALGKSAVFHPIKLGKRSFSAYLSPIRSTKAAFRSIKAPLSDEQLTEVQSDLEQMPLPDQEGRIVEH